MVQASLGLMVRPAQEAAVAVVVTIAPAPPIWVAVREVVVALEAAAVKQANQVTLGELPSLRCSLIPTSLESTHPHSPQTSAATAVLEEMEALADSRGKEALELILLVRQR